MIEIKKTELIKNVEFLNSNMLLKGTIVETEDGSLIRSNGAVYNVEGTILYATFYIEEGVSLSMGNTIDVNLLPMVSEVFKLYYTELKNGRSE